MPEGDSIHRAAAALRTALVDEKMIRFEAPRLIGITPRAGRTIERVECHGRHVEIEWDDETILHTNLRLRGSWYVHRLGDAWQRPHHELRVLIEVDGWVAVCFNAPMVETYRRPDPLRHPGLRGLGPDLAWVDADLARCVQALVTYDDAAPRSPTCCSTSGCCADSATCTAASSCGQGSSTRLLPSVISPSARRRG